MTDKALDEAIERVEACTWRLPLEDREYVRLVLAAVQRKPSRELVIDTLIVEMRRHDWSVEKMADAILAAVEERDALRRDARAYKDVATAWEQSDAENDELRAENAALRAKVERAAVALEPFNRDARTLLTRWPGHWPRASLPDAHSLTVADFRLLAEVHAELVAP